MNRGINDHLRGVGRLTDGRASGLLRQRQMHDAWSFPLDKRQGIDTQSETRPTDCPQCFGIGSRCPLDTPDQRCCPHRT